jgi:hypothetical protein
LVEAPHTRVIDVGKKAAALRSTIGIAALNPGLSA